jgi:hypothetical protein
MISSRLRDFPGGKARNDNIALAFFDFTGIHRDFRASGAGHRKSAVKGQPQHEKPPISRNSRFENDY